MFIRIVGLISSIEFYTGQGLISPEEIRPFPKVAPRSEQTKRKKVMSQVMTSTPVKRALEEAAESKKKNQGRTKEKGS